jgi:glycosyltransferase involved in cell wall biosynthesis
MLRTALVQSAHLNEREEIGQLPMRILQVSTSDIGGGAEKVAWNLLQAYRARGHEAWLAVGYKLTDNPDVLVISHHHRDEGWSGFWLRVQSRLQDRAGRMGIAYWPSRLARGVAEPRRSLDRCLGLEDFRFPRTWDLPELAPQRPDIVHCHNLHGGYFDLTALPWLSQELPVLLTLHDAWLLSGHCAHSFECQRWRTGCGHCPDLTIYPAVRRDATVYNWRRKQAIYAKSRLYLATPSRWLMNRVEQSMLAPGVVEARVIPNGIDLSVFRQADRQAVRPKLGIPQDARVLLFAANGIHRNIYKDYETMRAAVARVADRLDEQKVLFVALGESSPAEQVGRAEIRFTPYQESPEAVARYYQAADVYLHAARTDTFPNTVLEALACGLPTVATAVGGVVEQVRDGATGYLTPRGGAEEMAVRVEQLLRDEPLRLKLSENAVLDAQQRFDLNRQADDYLAWYEELTSGSSRQSGHTTSSDSIRSLRVEGTEDKP